MNSTAGIECRPEPGVIAAPKPLNAEQQARLEKARSYVQQNCNALLLLDQVAEVAGFSKFHFHRLFRAHFGKTLKQFVTECQVELSKRLLLEGVPVRDAAERAGFANQSHFTSRFKRVTGTTPAKWFKAHRALQRA